MAKNNEQQSATRYKEGFINQAVIANPQWRPRADNLEHERLAEFIYKTTMDLPPGAVVSVEGGWGRGKTDIISRIAYWHNRRLTDGNLDSDVEFISDDLSIWINPWQYGSPDLLTPLVIALGKRAKKSKHADEKKIERAFHSLIKAGLHMGLKSGASMLLSGHDNIMKAGSALAKTFWKELTKEDDDKWEADPVSSMSETFAFLVDQIKPEEERLHGGRLLIFVDDLDRCLPEQQVAMLEAINFLTGSGAAASFIVALDPHMADVSLKIHYQTTEFSTRLYLDKIFTRRLTLPSVSEVGNLIDLYMQKNLMIMDGGENPQSSTLETRIQQLGLNVGVIKSTIEQYAQVSREHANPRALDKLIDGLSIIMLNRKKRYSPINAHGKQIDRRTFSTILLSMLYIQINNRQLYNTIRATSKQNYLGQIFSFYTKLNLSQQQDDAHKKYSDALGAPQRNPQIIELLTNIENSLPNQLNAAQLFGDPKFRKEIFSWLDLE